MLINSQSRTTMLFETLSEMGMLSTEERYVRIVREETNSDTFFTDTPLSTMDVDRVSYQNPHIEIDPEQEGYLEIWVDGHYEHPSRIQWVGTYPYRHAVLTQPYDPMTQTAKVFYNPGILYRYSKWYDDTVPRRHRVTIDIRQAPYNQLDNPDRSAYYIVDNEVRVPEAEWLDDYRIRFTAQYVGNIDFMITNTLAGIFQAKAGVGLYIDSPDSPICYHHIVIDFDPSYPIDARFYPCICVDKDCTVRVFNDNFHLIKYPEVQRLMNYPEYADLTDPYNLPNVSEGKYEYLRTLKEVDDFITSSDSDEVILQKFHRIVRFCYRIWEKFPKFGNEMSDFLICDNLDFGREYFQKGTVALTDVKDTFIYSTAPYEPHRDILLYDGVIFSDYQIRNLVTTQDGSVVESNSNGIPTYVIDPSYELNRFTLLKFNAWEDTNIMNIGDYIDVDRTVELHTKLNKFYRNLVVVRQQLLTQPEDDFARIMTVEPSVKDNYLWFELLTNVNPEEFENNAPLIIHLYGINGEYIPEDVAKGAYMLNLDPETGPEEYSKILSTYYSLGQEHQRYLVLQHDDLGPNPNTKVYYDLKVGNKDNIENPNHGLVLNDPTIDTPYSEKTIDIGTTDTPEIEGAVPGDIYVQQMDDTIQAILNGPDTPVGGYQLTNLTYQKEDGSYVTEEDLNALSRTDKIGLILPYISQDPSQNSHEHEQVLGMTNEQLNHTVLSLLKTQHVLTSVAAEDPSLLQTPASPEDRADIIQQNVKYILSETEPDFPEINDIWIQVPDIPFEDYYRDVVSYELLECYHLPKNPHYDPDRATYVLNYGPYGEPDDPDVPEIFRPVLDETPHPIHYGPTEPENPNDYDIWYEYMDETIDKVAYFDKETIIVRVNERLVGLKLGHDNIEGFLFDDVVMNFRGDLGIKYLSIAADLFNAGVLSKDNMILFYQRLITCRDQFDLDIRRLYTGTSHVVSLSKIDTSDFSVIYSSNIKRFTMNYADEETNNREREAAWKHCIDTRYRQFSFLPDRMILFVNGKYIPRTEYHEDYAYRIQLTNFDEIIKVVDIFYSQKDEELMEIKKSAYAYWPLDDKAVSIQRPERDYDKMIPIDVYQKTLRGYYDILLNDFILNEKLLRLTAYVAEHPEEREMFIREFVQWFHDISDLDLTMGTIHDSPKIIIPGGGFDQRYTVSES